MMFDLTGKTALVTGASGGIGAEVARVLHAAGARVGLSGTRVAPLEALAAELGGRTHVLPCDLSDGAAVDALPKAAAEAMGGLDILVNNAGITRDGLMLRMSDADWDAVVAVNMTATFKLSRGALRPMMKARWGRIINISSVVAVGGNPGQANYAAAKAGVIGMSKSLAAEVASRNITVNCVAPGFIATAMTDKLSEDQKTALLSGVPAGRMVRRAGARAARAHRRAVRARCGRRPGGERLVQFEGDHGIVLRHQLEHARRRRYSAGPNSSRSASPYCAWPSALVLWCEPPSTSTKRFGVRACSYSARPSSGRISWSSLP